IAERREAEQHFRVVAETATDSIVSADQAGRIVYLNPAAEQLFGHAAAQAIGQSLTLFMPARYHDSHVRGLARFLATGEKRVVGRTIELAGKRKDGSEFPLELSLASWRLGSETFFTGILRDISARKRGEEKIRRLNVQMDTANQELERTNSKLKRLA